MSATHRRIWKEDRWPFQWLAECACGIGIRCNHEDEARMFLAENCRREASRATPEPHQEETP